MDVLQDRRIGKDRRLPFLSGLDRRQSPNHEPEQLRNVTVTPDNFVTLEQKVSAPDLIVGP